MLQIVCAERYRFDGEHLTEYDSLQLGRSYIARLCLISGGSSAPPIQPLPLPALSFRHLFNSFYEFTVNLVLRRPSYNYCCSGGHRTTTAAPRAIAHLLLLRWPSHNSCSAAIAPASSTLVHQSLTVLQNLFTSSLIECYSPYLPIVVGRALFIFVAN